MGAYLPIALFAVAATVFAVIGLVAGGLIRPAGRDLEGKLEPYECGVEPVRDARQRFSIRFYIVAMLFLIFDVETIFFFPGQFSSDNWHCSDSSKWSSSSRSLSSATYTLGSAGHLNGSSGT